MDHWDPLHDEQDFEETQEQQDYSMEEFETGEAIVPDEGAMDAAGLDEPADAVIGRILRETREELGEEAPEDRQPQEAPPEEFRDQEYRDTFDSDFEAVMDGSLPEAEQASPEPGKRWKRKKRKRRGSGLLGIPHFLCTIVLWCIVIMIGFTAAMVVWTCADDLLALTKDDREISVTILESDSMEDITQKLVDAGLVRYGWLFQFYADHSTNTRDKISEGTFVLNSMYDYHAIVNAMGRSSSNRTEVEVMIPEGYTCRQIFQLLEKEEVCTVEELEQAAKTGELGEYWFLEELPRDSEYCLEGYLFPDTYYFYTDDDPVRVLRKLLNNFENKFDDALLARVDQLNESYAQALAAFGYDEETIAKRRLTPHDVVIIASMIEKESAGAGESDLIASVIYNRLCDPDYLYLNIDATVLYALGDHKGALTQEDLAIDSPYNTYKVIGLPAGPISNPGINSLRAALMPEDTDYYYYALDTDGTHYFTRTLEEHNEFLASLGSEPDE